MPVATVFAVTFSIERGIFMARKSRKHKYKEELKFLSSVAVGYIRLSVANKEESSSIENQKFIIECWGEQQQIPMSHYYIDNGFSGKFSDRTLVIRGIHHGSSSIVPRRKSSSSKDEGAVAADIVFFISNGKRGMG